MLVRRSIMYRGGNGAIDMQHPWLPAAENPRVQPVNCTPSLPRSTPTFFAPCSFHEVVLVPCQVANQPTSSMSNP